MQVEVINAIFYILVLLMSVVIHEVSHGFMALHYGDDTALHAGRLTLNPLKHLDPFGSVILPLILYFTTHFTFGWARPVPYNPTNFKNQKQGIIAVASAGILANFFIAIFFGIVLRLLIKFNFANPSILFIISSIVIVNIALAVFNLVPIPPLDGSRILFTLLPRSMDHIIGFLERNSLFLFLIFILFFTDFLVPLMLFSFHFITGLSF